MDFPNFGALAIILGNRGLRIDVHITLFEMPDVSARSKNVRKRRITDLLVAGWSWSNLRARLVLGRIHGAAIRLMTYVGIRIVARHRSLGTMCQLQH